MSKEREYNLNGIDPVTKSSNFGIIDEFASFMLGSTPANPFSVFGELSGINSQQREFEQQEYLLNKQQDFALDYKSKMQAMIDAGINPNTAAAGLAGTSSNPSAPSVNSNTGGVAGAADSLANIANAVTGGKASLADAAFKENTLEPTIEKLRNEAAKTFEEIGLSKANAQIAAANAEYADESAFRDIQVKRVSVEKIQQEYKNMKAEHERILSDIDLKLQQAKTLQNESDYYAELAKRTQEETRWIKLTNDFFEENGYDLRTNSDHMIIAQLLANGRDPLAYIDAWIDYHGKSQSAISEAEQSAIDKHAYSIANAQEMAKSLNQIITDWNTPASSLWGIIEKTGNLSGNRSGKNNIGSAIDARDNPDEYAGYTQLMVALALSLDDINKQIESATGNNELSRIRELSKQKEGLQNFIKGLTFEHYQQHLHRKQ